MIDDRAEEKWGGVLVDGLAVVALVAIFLSLLDKSFWSRGYLVAGLVPVVFLVATALVLRRATDGASLYALVALIAYAPLGSLVALQRPGPWLFPTFDTMTRVLGESVAAPQLFVNTLPPVEASGTLMLVPFALGYLAGVPAAWFAVATRGPDAAVGARARRTGRDDPSRDPGARLPGASRPGLRDALRGVGRGSGAASWPARSFLPWWSPRSRCWPASWSPTTMRPTVPC